MIKKKKKLPQNFLKWQKARGKRLKNENKKEEVS